ncbi:unnamed protein product [Paramecium pentaurelia]|uniref:Protein YIF1 n=1 Tax=Paramecium pentaurelia TaxID=43138 RepID=A0A8S1TDD5_9CILI|nr:unnamed protein product [Paramecium pentaurelia]
MKPELIPITDPLDFIMMPIDQNKSFQSRIGNPQFEETASNIGKKIAVFGRKYDNFISSLFSSQYRYYFDVDNEYIKQKLILLHAPIIYRGDWTLSNETQNFLTTKNIQAPDLYLPLMGLITLVLLQCLNIGINNATQYISIYMINSIWKCLIISFIEVIFMRIMFYLFGNLKVSIIDLISISNYRYCSLTTLFIFNLMTYHIFWTVGTIYILLSQAVFVYKSSQICIEQQIQKCDNSLDPTLALLLSLLQITCSCLILFII